MLQKVFIYFSYIIAAFLLLSSTPTHAQESDKVWAVGMNYHLLQKHKDQPFRGLNIILERKIGNRFSTSFIGSYFFKQDIQTNRPFYSEDYSRTAGYLGAQLKGDIITVNFLTFYGKAGLHHFITSVRGVYSYFNDVGPPPLRRTQEFAPVDSKSGYDLGLGLEINSKVILFAELLLAHAYTDGDSYGNIHTGIKFPF